MSDRPRRGRPTSAEAAAIETRLRDAAVDAFVTNGFDGTTMEAVAAAAGVTRRTLYAKYPDKQTLFATVIPRALADMPFRQVEVTIPDGDLESALRASAYGIVDRLVQPEAVRLRRFAMLEAHRIAALDQVGNADLWSASLSSIVALLTADAERSDIVVEDPKAAADLFVSMVAGGPTVRADMGVIDSPAELASHIDNAVRLFLRGVLHRP